MPSYTLAQEQRIRKLIEEHGAHRSAADERFIAEKYLALEEETAEYYALEAAGQSQRALKEKKNLLQSLKVLLSKS